MDIIYTLSDEAATRSNDWELRMSLRSWAQNYELLGDVYLVGHCPAWLDTACDGIHHIPFPDPYRSNKDANLIQKLAFASTHLMSARGRSMSSPFIFCSDDQGLLRRIHSPEAEDAAFQRWQAGVIERSEKNTFRRRLTRTGEYLTGLGVTPYYHDVHIPFRLSAEMCLNAMLSDYGADLGYTVMSLIYGLSGDGEAPSLKGRGVRALFNSKRPGRSFTERVLNENLFYSLSEKAMNWPEVRESISRRFPSPLQWEIDRR